MKSYFALITSMLIWGSLPIFVNSIEHLTSVEIVFCRVIIAILTLLIISFIKKEKSEKGALKKYAPRLLLTGVSMGLNWVLLFESYRFVDSGVSTLMYYLAPVIVMIGSFVIFREKISAPRIIAIVLAVIGMVIITDSNIGGSDPVKGIILAVLSAFFYACVTLSDKCIEGLGGITITLGQLFGALCTICPYALIVHKGPFPSLSVKEIFSVIILGTVHSGIALWLYFSSIRKIPAQSIAVLSYIDPVSSIFFVTLILGEALTLPKIIGGVLIIGGAVFGELLSKKKCDV